MTDELVAILIDKIGEGVPLSTACAFARIDYSNYRIWMKRGRSDADEDREFRAFRAAILNARAEAESKLVKSIKDDDDWRAKAFILERSFGGTWKPSQKLHHAGRGGGPVLIKTVEAVKPSGVS